MVGLESLKVTSRWHVGSQRVFGKLLTWASHAREDILWRLSLGFWISWLPDFLYRTPGTQFSGKNVSSYMERNWGDWVSEHGLSGKLILNQIVMATEEVFIPLSLCSDFSLQNFVLWLRTWRPLIYQGPLRYLIRSLWERVLFAINSHLWAEQFTLVVNFQETTIRACLQSGTANLSDSAVIVTCGGAEEITAALDIPWIVRNIAVRLTVSSET